jgi:Holliday junction resolvase RusA-like endonuclease
MQIHTGKTIEITLDLPKPPSLNEYYSGRHFAIRKKQGDTYKKIVKDELEKYDKYFAKGIELHIAYCSRYDCDNSILASKFTADALVALGYVQDDSPKYFRSLSIRFDGDLPKNTYKVKIILIDAEPRSQDSKVEILSRQRSTESDRLPAEGVPKPVRKYGKRDK